MISIHDAVEGLNDNLDIDTGLLIRLLQEAKPYPDIGIGWAEGQWFITDYFDHGVIGEARIIGKNELLNVALKQAILNY